METWMEQGSWAKLKNRLSKSFNWWCIHATKKKTKGRAKGGIVTAIKKNMGAAEFKEWGRGIAEVRFKVGEKSWRVLTVYNQDIEDTMKTITEGIEESQEECLVIGGDLNARVGEEGGPIREWMKEETEERKSKDKKVNREGRILLERINERGWVILNGCYG